MENQSTITSNKFGTMPVFITALIILNNSSDTDHVIVGFREQSIKPIGIELFTGYNDLSNILFVNSNKEKEIR